jgi:hypothetical protein
MDTMPPILPPRSISLAVALLLLAACGTPPPREQAAAPDTTPAATPGDTLADVPAFQEMGIDSGPAMPADSTVGSICPHPDHPCGGFRTHDLSFVLPTDDAARDEVRSEQFYAILLRSGPGCSIPEADRAATQSRFPDRKVFLHRFGCDDDVENNVTYTNVNGSLAFLAVYAGRTREEADSTLRALQQGGAFPGSNLRRMEVRFVSP